MTTHIIDGKIISKEIKEEVKHGAEDLKRTKNIIPGLVTILVGENSASASYVRAKQKTAQSLGFYSVQENCAVDISEEKLLQLITRYNEDNTIHGILVQLPLPTQINETSVLYAIKPEKDVDGFHPINIGKLMIGKADFLPCTPAGIQQLLVRSNIAIAGSHVVVVGRSNIVGKPIANILLQKNPNANATVTICHTATAKLESFTQQADILIVAAGRQNAITGDMVKQGVVVIDVGVNQVGTTETGKRKLVGDVDFESVAKKASAITPVPGGVGPMTISMLMHNTLKAAQLSN